MRRALGLALLLVAGCAPQERAQQALIASLEQGVADISGHEQQRQQVIEAFYRQQRRMLDDAFDADARGTTQLDAEWVIEARRAYAAAMEATWSGQHASAAAHQRAQDNLAAMGEALRRLAWMSELRANWSEAWLNIAKEVKREQD